MANLAYCRQLEVVELMGTATGDGTIRALTGMPRLRHIQAGSLITDDGVRHFHEFPVFKTWQGGEASIALTSPEAGPNFLWLNLRSPLTNRGLAHLEGLDGLFALSLFGISGMPAFEDKDFLRGPVQVELWRPGEGRRGGPAADRRRRKQQQCLHHP